MTFHKTSILLASASPRRLELLLNLDIPVRQIKIKFEEHIHPGLSPKTIVKSISSAKFKQALPHLRNGELLLTADTLVFQNGKILAKPKSNEEAFAFLERLSGSTHTVITGVTIGQPERHATFTSSTRVYFDTISSEEIAYYIEQYKPFDKAGGYGIQEWIGWAKVKKITGSFSNVMGLPTHEVHQWLQSFMTKRSI